LISKGAGRKGLALAAVGVLGLTACSTTAGTGEGDTSDATFTYAYEQELDTYNQSTSGGNASKNAIPLNRVLPGFWRYATDGTIEATTDFGTYEKTSDDPLTVEYTFDENAVWSDGEAIDCDDAYLAYIAQSGKYKEFDPAGVTGYDLIDSFECEDGDKQFTITYSEPFADWSALFGTFMPAHVLEQQTGVTDFVASAKANDAAAMAQAATFWNEGWVFQGALPEESLIPSAGPYKISQWVPGQSLTLVANDKWWGEAPKTGTVVIRFVGADAQAQALENGEINAMDPQPTPDLIAQLNGLGEAVEVVTGDQLTFEHLDYNFKSPVWANESVREAFALCVPRQQIIDNLIKPQNDAAVILNSRYVFPFQPNYEDVVAATDAERFDEVNIDEAKQLLSGSGVATPTVKIGYIAENKRRADTFALIKASCEQAGFTIVDGASPTFFDEGGELESGNFDVALFAWAGSTLVTGSSSTYTTDGGNNFGSYSNPEVDRLTAQLNITPDAGQQLDLIKEIETILWSDLATIPLFTFPGLAAWSSNAEGVEYNSSQGGLTWNMDQWELTS
jgi:peptide/nickel transport system substrate-binding protein